MPILLNKHCLSLQTLSHSAVSGHDIVSVYVCRSLVMSACTTLACSAVLNHGPYDVTEYHWLSSWIGMWVVCFGHAGGDGSEGDGGLGSVG
jgi:hypothetical protein